MAEAAKKASEKSKASLKKLMDWIKSELDPDSQMLWTTFLEYDESVDAKLNKEELKKMLQYFDNTAKDAEIEEHVKSILPDSENEVNFNKLLDWWDKQKTSEGSRVGLRSMLMARFAAQKLKSWSWDLLGGKSSMEKRIEELSESAIENSLQKYSTTLINMGKRKVELQDKALDAQEAELNKQFDEHLKQLAEKSPEGVEIDDYDLYKLQKLFAHFAKKDGTVPQSKLGEISMCLGFDMPDHIARMTSRIYPASMREGDFMKWCNARGLDSASSIVNKTANMVKGMDVKKLNIFAKDK